MAVIGSSMAYELRSPMIRKSGSSLPVGSVASQSTSAWAAFSRVPLQLPCPSPASGSAGRRSVQAEPFDLRWLTTTVNLAPVAFSCERLGQRRPALVVDEARDRRREVSHLKAPTGVTAAGR